MTQLFLPHTKTTTTMPSDMPAQPVGKLFEPLQAGSVELGHRIALAPLTRFRAEDDHVHSGE